MACRLWAGLSLALPAGLPSREDRLHWHREFGVYLGFVSCRLWAGLGLALPVGLPSREDRLH